MQESGMERIRREREIGFPTQYGPVRGDKKPGHALVPHEAYRDLVVILLMVAITLMITGIAIPALGIAANPFESAIEPPDWYLLWTWGLLQVVEIFPEVTVLGITLSTLVYGALLTAVPVLILLALPFIDRGFEARPAKANIRAAFGVAGLVWVTTASIYSIRAIILGHFVTAEGARLVTDDTLKWMFIVEPVLAGMVAYVATRRLGFKPMRRVNTAFNGGALLLMLLISAYIFGFVLLDGPALGALFSIPNLWLALYIGLALATGVVALYIVYFLDEAQGRRTLFRWIGVLLLILVPVSWYLMTFQRAVFDHVQVFVMTNSHTFIAFPVFALLVTYFGQRTPYSDYEYKLNECYQCGRCHLVCPITKADADALGGLNLVYNVYKRQHDGVPMWACLTCDACSAVCPLDINYSAYVLTERARVMKERQRIPERPAVTKAATDGGRET